MAMINYADKVALNSNSGIADINKCNATDMNEIKSALNNYVQTGWYTGRTGTTYAFVSWNSTTKIGIVSTSQDVTSLLSVGMKVRFVQNATTKYGIIVDLTSTKITLFMGTDYTLTNSGITDAYYSIVKAPYRFPMDPAKWTLKVTLPAGSTISNPVAGTVYTTGLALLIPKGKWKVSGIGTGQVDSTSTTAVRVATGLSTTNNSYSDLENITFAGYNIPSAGAQTFFSGAPINFEIELSTDTTYYYNYSTTSSNVSNLTLVSNTFANTPHIKAVCGYL